MLQKIRFFDKKKDPKLSLSELLSDDNIHICVRADDLERDIHRRYTILEKKIVYIVPVHGG
jgi:hypothetical protein